MVGFSFSEALVSYGASSLAGNMSGEGGAVD